VDTIDPAAPVFTLAPPDPSHSATSTFDWTPHLPPADVDHFECSRENGAFVPCGPPPTSFAVATTNSGRHQFAVRAVDAAGNVSGAGTYTWKVEKGSGEDFRITGDAAGPIYPGGPAQPILLVVHNPNDVPIYVTALTVALTTDTPNGCSRANLVLTQANLATAGSTPGAIVVPAGGSVTLPAQGVGAPTIRLVDNGTDQTPACANETFVLSYSGSAHS